VNSNPEDAGLAATAFHNPSRCVIPDLAHAWRDSHLEANFEDPNGNLTDSPNDGFVRMNDDLYQPDRGIETATEDPTMGFYTQVDLPFYYDLAQKFAIDDRYFASVIGPTLPNRLYLLAATSFGHVSTGDVNYLPPDGLKPSTGTILDLLDSRGITWTDYYEVVPQAGAFRRPSDTKTPTSGLSRSFSPSPQDYPARPPCLRCPSSTRGTTSIRPKTSARPGVRLACRQCDPKRTLLEGFGHLHRL